MTTLQVHRTEFFCIHTFPVGFFSSTLSNGRNSVAIQSQLPKTAFNISKTNKPIPAPKKDLRRPCFYDIVIEGGLEMGNDFNKVLGERIAKARKVKKMSQAELAQKLGITNQVISNWERGYSPIPATALSSISDILSCPILYFFSKDTAPLPPINESESLLLSLYRANKEFHSVVEKLIAIYKNDSDRDNSSL